MQAFKFLDKHFGLKSLYERRLKISHLNELNDPFEFLPWDLSNSAQRQAARAARDEFGSRFGILCFSAAWSDPVIWAHYADKHRGLCLGFEIPDGKCKLVKYVSKRLPFPTNPPTLTHGEEFWSTKYDHWEYEQEIRASAELKEKEDGMYFCDFGEALRLTSVIAGAACTAPRTAVERALGLLAGEVELIKARSGFTKFEVVRDQRGWM